MTSSQGVFSSTFSFREKKEIAQALDVRLIAAPFYNQKTLSDRCRCSLYVALAHEKVHTRSMVLSRPSSAQAARDRAVTNGSRTSFTRTGDSSFSRRQVLCRKHDESTQSVTSAKLITADAQT